MHLPVCIAKRSILFRRSQKLGAPDDFVMEVRDLAMLRRGLYCSPVRDDHAHARPPKNRLQPAYILTKPKYSRPVFKQTQKRYIRPDALFFYFRSVIRLYISVSITAIIPAARLDIDSVERNIVRKHIKIQIAHIWMILLSARDGNNCRSRHRYNLFDIARKHVWLLPE